MDYSNMHSLTNLPTEVLLKVLTYLPAKDISKCRKVSRKLNTVVESFPFHLQRTRCRLEARCGESLSLAVRRSDSSTVTELTSEMLSQICRMEVSELTITSSGNTLSHDSAVAKILKILEKSKQNSIKIVNVRGICLQNPVLAQGLLSQFSTSFIQELNLWCPISKQLTPKHIAVMDSLCQLRIAKDQENQISKDSADSVVLKFAHDMRYKLRIGIPFVAEINELSPEVVVRLIKEWIFIPESSVFQIAFTGCDHEWLIRFAEICEQEQLRHTFYEFPSKTNPYSHIKMKIHEESNSCVIFPIKDVPARSPIQNYVCFARYYRDF